VFFLDEHQIVRPGELGSVSEIRGAADRLGIKVREVRLDGQFRCGGSEAYELWVLRLLGLAPGGPTPWQGDDHFSLALAGSPAAMEEQLRRQQDAGFSALYQRRLLLALERCPSGRQPR
jgi:hypothetical protein